MLDTVVIYHPHAGAVAERLSRAGFARKLVPLHEREELAAHIAEVEILLTEEPPRDLWARASRLRLIQTLGAGVDGVLPAPDLPEGVVIANARGLFAAEVAEHAILMMLALQRGLRAHVARQSERTWRPFASGSLEGRTLGILGLGEVGRRVAALGSAFGMHVVGMCRRPREVPHVIEVVGPEGMANVLQKADHLVITLPLTPATRGLVGRDALSSVRRGAYLIHVGRGGVVSEAALAEALSTGHLGGAAVDVCEAEPLPSDHELWTVPNLLITPHIAGLGLRYVERLAPLLETNIQRLSRGEEPLHRTDRQAGY